MVNRKWLAAGLAVVVLLTSGYTWVESNRYDTVEYVTTLKRGETFWSVCEDFYDQNEDKSMCFDEFRYEVRQRNLSLLRNGRIPQYGDVVIIPVKKIRW